MVLGAFEVNLPQKTKEGHLYLIQFFLVDSHF